MVNNFQIAKAKKSSGFPLVERLDLCRSLRGDLAAQQLAQGSYLKDLRYLNLNECRLSQKAFNEIIASPNLRSVEVLLFRKNRVVQITGPFGDLEELDEKQRKKQTVMRLKLLDLRENKVNSIFQREAVAFLKETIVLMWNNPFNADQPNTQGREYQDPACLFRATNDFEDDFRLIQNPLHIFYRTP